MLDKVMMERKEVRKDYDERLAHLEIRMGELQRQCRSMGTVSYTHLTLPTNSRV